MCAFDCTTFIEYMTVGQTLLGYTNLSFPNDYKENNKVIYRVFKDKYDQRKHKS